MMKFVVAFVFTIAFTYTGDAQIATQRSWLVDIPSCPVRIGVTSLDQGLILENSARTRITEIQFGIVGVSNGKYRVLKKLSLVKLELSKDSGVIYRLDSLSDDAELSNKVGGRLAVIRAVFVDGAEWGIRKD